jgi:RimJ/RimL family protein N-acetyltransferase
VRMPFLVGETIYFRPLEPGDGVDAARWFRERELGGRFGSGLPMSEEAAVRHVESLTRDERQVGVAVARRADDKLVGAIRIHSLQPQRRSGAYRLALDPAARGGERIAMEATRLVLAYVFETLGLNRLWLCESAGDETARRRFAKAGFTEEGILRQEAWKNGAYEDVVVMAILREEWERRR